ncbi:SUMF1/EgtB/PvdO family nonheme iron enzyme [Pseudomonas sp. NPDC007930]|uniref:formylglycine-generating enzyme family protein n=1 Tax=Pseudomonas sp. NPDC007930 TaxID=3364417 RepID=UPI0036EEDAF1
MNEFPVRYSKAFVLLLAATQVGCDQVEPEVRTSGPLFSELDVENFKLSIMKGLVFIEGGSFMMGDYSQGKLMMSLSGNNSYVHAVKLSDFHIAKFKITNRDYQLYLLATNGSYNESASRAVEKFRSAPNNPAHLDWYESEKYCNWLASITNLPFSLPTEAQWEYAARARGLDIPVATASGTWDVVRVAPVAENDRGIRGLNAATDWDRNQYSLKMGWGTDYHAPLPVDYYPPGSLGIYAMTDNGLEWVKDWYDPNYYKSSPGVDPQGPVTGVFKNEVTGGVPAKTLRGATVSDPHFNIGATVQRTYEAPDAAYVNQPSGMRFYSLRAKTARCVVNSPGPISGESPLTTGAH